MSSDSRLRSAASLPSVRVDNADARSKFTGSPFDEPDVTVGEPTRDDRQKAKGIFDGNEDFIQKEKAAAWMGEEGLVRQRTLRAYMDLYDFANHSVLSSLRQICNRLVLKAETQQVDRILVAFSKRWCECNSNHGFKTMDVIHTMCYSIMLLNTDLHMADIDQKMTRSQFVKNTMSTIKQAAIDSAPDAFEHSTIPYGKTDLLTPTDSDNRMSGGQEQEHRINWRSSFKPLPRTQTSMSMDSFGSGYPGGDYQQSIGFANALSQAIIREDLPPATSGQSIMSEEFPSAQLLDDESLELAGSPWMKEGIVIHKHHLDGVDRKAKDRNWAEVFAVVQKGTMSLFSFSTKSMRHKARHGRKQAVGPGAVVGGGNWQDNATSVGTFSLRQTLASALPPPGYSRTRSHVWALSLPTGAVHLFQVGTPEISKEFVLTVNYWSSRLSTHPLIGGVSNIEYGWSDAVINSALIASVSESPQQPPRPGSAAAGRSSMHSRQGSRQSSLRSSFDVGSNNNRAKLPGDKVTIAEWKPPTQSMRPSNCSESEQLDTLLNYVRSIEDDLQRHNQLRSPMLLAFTPRGHNAAKAMANWERKSSHLLREIVKFRTYVDSLQHAEARRAEIYTERDNAQRAARGEDLSDEEESLAECEGDITIKPE
ncbi:putative sec7 domain-containing protein [Eutypa lata UCREL1]|uniref:Putative sec7 domain-containing protein n=1 Tax=Eutypa lata (strain UCR-EL1) TaxID=1287681 RepID=M7SSK0_EUTLA|nr:putative sec7 domain-containing protein [Eutypa lata UCREL1]